jgi:hypothetical protein
MQTSGSAAIKKLIQLVKASLSGKMDKSGGTFTGNVSGQCFTGTLLQSTAATDLGKTPGKIAVLDDAGRVHYRTPEELLDDIGASGGGADYVTEQGLTGKWMWRKWASGIAEMWATFDSPSLDMTTQTWGALYTASWMGLEVNKKAREYPFAFIENPVVSATPTVANGNIWIATNTENDIGTRLTHAPAYQCVRASDATVNSPQISYYVVGRYK